VIDLASPAWLLTLAGVAALAVHVRRALAARKEALATLAAGDEAWRRRVSRRHAASASIVLAALALAGVALARPVWGPPVESSVARGADVVIAIDVSLSMLASDASPSRLERAKLVVRDLVGRLEGDRVGLVGFAGSGAVLLPLTLDTEAAMMFADDLEAQSVDEPGTAIERAVDRAVEMFDRAGKGERVLVVVSDGEDQSSDPVAAGESAAAVARDAGVRVVAVTVGTEVGAEIPLDAPGVGVVKRDAEGRPVVTRARRDVMAALAVDGLALDADRGDEAERIAAFVDEGAAAWERGEAVRDRPERFQWFLLASFALLAAEGLLRRTG
jgi:Ca-activated chloride channel family protein